MIEAGINTVAMPEDGQIASSIEERALDLVILGQQTGESLELVLVYDGSSPRARASRNTLEPLIEPLREQRQADLEQSLDLSPGDLSPFPIEEVNTASEGQKMAMLMSMLVPLFLLMCMVMAGIYPAVELVVGERVRGTLETTMAAPVPRSSLIAGKILAVLSLMLLAIIANGISMGLTLVHLVSMMMDDVPSLELDWLSIIAAMPLLLSTVVLTATTLVLAALPVQTFKAGQNVVSTVALFAMMPCMVGVIPGLEFSLFIACIPLSNTAIVLRDVLNGEGLHALAWLSFSLNSLLAIAGLWLAARITRSEHFLFGPSTGGLKRWRLILGRVGRGARP
jgi:ABC-type Na+ efflux pump permease subunit